MKKTLPHLVSLLFVTCLLWSVVLTPAQAQPPGWSGDENLAFLLEVNEVSAADSDAANPIPVDLANPLTIELSINVSSNIVLHTGAFVMMYMAIPIINQPFEFGLPVPAGTATNLMNTSLNLGEVLTVGGFSLFSGTITGSFTFIYSLTTDIGTNLTATDDFVLRIGSEGLGALASVTGLITAGFTVMGIFSLLMALDDFQQGIMAARKMRGAKRGSDVGIFPKPVVLRRKPKKKKDGEHISKEDLVDRVSKAAPKGWDGKRCPKCGKKWNADLGSWSKCNIDKPAAIAFFSEDIAKYSPKAMKAVPPKSKVTVGKFSKKLRLKPNKGGALAAALTDMGIFQTKSVKVPLKKVSMAGLTLAGTYWSWMQMIAGATPDILTVALTTTAGLVISIIIGYFMNFLARVPKLGYDN